MIKFTEQQAVFLSKEFGIDVLANKEINIDRKDLSDIFNRCCDIEEEESIKHVDDEMSERGDIAIKIVDLIYPLLK